MQNFMFLFFRVMNVPRQSFRQGSKTVVYDCDKYEDTAAVIASKRMLDAAGVIIINKKEKKHGKDKKL